ncbi:MAG: hypothetical protein JWM80_4765 [Cyanobacteria bacterium RYN_339]|nr:hypothetical protein [Cyanobacteria bacterium RYN_339]
MSALPEWSDLPIGFAPQLDGDVRCQNVFGLVFYLRPIHNAPAVHPARKRDPSPSPPPRTARRWEKGGPGGGDARGLLQQFVARVLPSRKGDAS